MKNWFVPALEVNFLKKLPQLVALQIFLSSYINHGESLSHNILLIIIRVILNIFFKALYKSQQNYQIW